MWWVLGLVAALGWTLLVAALLWWRTAGMDAWRIGRSLIDTGQVRTVVAYDPHHRHITIDRPVERPLSAGSRVWLVCDRGLWGRRK